MKHASVRLEHCAGDVADKAVAAQKTPAAMDPLFEAMIKYREAAHGYLAHPSMGDLIKARALKYKGETSESVERIGELVDSLNEP